MGKLARSSASPIFVGNPGGIGDETVTKPVGLNRGALTDSARAVGRRTKGRKSMVRQSKEGRAVPEGCRKAVPTHGDECRGGGKATPVNEQTGQLRLPLGTAEDPAVHAAGADGVAAPHPRGAVALAVPKPRNKEEKVTSATMEEVTQHLSEAFWKVAANKGAPGPDRQSIDEVREHLDAVLSALASALLDGSYQPGNIRRVWIPKSGGGQRGLGIPNVVDRVAAEAVRQVLGSSIGSTTRGSWRGWQSASTTTGCSCSSARCSRPRW